MTIEKVTITAPNGLHARPAGDLVKLIKSFAPTKVSLRTPLKEVNAASILSVLSLGLKQGVELEVIADGGNESVAVDAIINFIAAIQD